MPDGKAFQPGGQFSLRRLDFGRAVGFPRLPWFRRAILSHQAQPSRPHFSRNRPISSSASDLLIFLKS